MGFIERAFTPPGAGGAPPGSPANPVLSPPTAAAAAPTPPAPPPAPPSAPTAPTPPATFQPGTAPGAQQRAAITGTTILGSAAAAGQTAKKSLLGQ